MKYSSKFSKKDVEKIAKLASIPTTDKEQRELSKGFNMVLSVINKLQKIDTKGIEPTHHVTGLENVYRDDEVEKERMFTQDEALANAKNTHSGYFVVKQVIDLCN